MHESPQELRALQALLDTSHARAGEHLRSIFRDERRMTAEQVVEELRGVFVLSLATVTAAGEPMLAPIDGLFFRGHLWIGVPPGAVRGHHIRDRPQVSANYTKGERVCVIAHGTARAIVEEDPIQREYVDYCREAYGPGVWDFWQDRYRSRSGSGLTARIEPRVLFAMSREGEAGEG